MEIDIRKFILPSLSPHSLKSNLDLGLGYAVIILTNSQVNKWMTSSTFDIGYLYKIHQIAVKIDL